MSEYESKMYIVDIETTGITGIPRDLILEIVIFELDKNTFRYINVYETVIKYPITEMIKESWIVKNGYISLQEISQGKELDIVVKEVQKILLEKEWTCFNVSFDYERFLKQEPYYLDPPQYCLMEKMTPIVREYAPWLKGHKYPKLQEAYKYLYNKDVDETHRAKEDTYLSTKITIKLLKRKRVLQLLKNLYIEEKKPFVIKYLTNSDRIIYRNIVGLKLGRSDTLLEAYDLKSGKDSVFNIMKILQLYIL
jgi:DNA polymerase III epsilon subunit-like protein